MKQAILILVMVIVSSNAFAYDYERALANLSEDFSKCAAFYIICGGALKTVETDETDLKKFPEASLKSLEYAIMTSNKKVTAARLELHNSEMLEDIDYSYANISVLLVKHSDICKGTLENPFSRLKYWLDMK